MNPALIIGVFQSVFLVSLILLKKSKKQLPDWLLSGSLVAIGLHLLIHQLFALELVGTALSIFGSSVPFFQGPLLLLYVQSQTGIIDRMRNIHLLHLLPPLLLMPLFFIPTWKGSLVSIYNLAFVVQITGYILFSLRTIKKHEKTTLSYFSSTAGVDLRWLKFIIYGLGLVWGATLLTFFFQITFDFDPTNTYMVFFYSIAIFVYLIAIFGIRQKHVFFESDKKATSSKYERSKLSGEFIEATWIRLKTHLSENKVYLNPALTLAQLAEDLEITTNHLSQILNTKTTANFHDFVNGYRVEEVKTRIQSNRYNHLTLLAIAFESGFQSKASFNRVFKKIQGCTPSEYHESISLNHQRTPVPH